MQNTNTTTNTNTNNSGTSSGNNTGNISNGLSISANEIGSLSTLSSLSRELLLQQTEILSKIDLLLSNQNRLERALQAALLSDNNVNAGSLTGIDASGINARA